MVGWRPRRLTPLRMTAADAGRVTLGALFACGGLLNWTQYGRAAMAVRDAGLPAPELLARTNAAVMLAAGTALSLGVRPDVSASSLAGVLVPTTVVGHPFWRRQDLERVYELQNFTKNVALLGALLIVGGEGPAAKPGLAGGALRGCLLVALVSLGVRAAKQLPEPESVPSPPATGRRSPRAAHDLDALDQPKVRTS